MVEDGGDGEVGGEIEELGGEDGEGEASWGTNNMNQVESSKGAGTSELKQRTSRMRKFLKVQ